MNQLFVKKTREEQPQQILGDARDGAFGRQIFAIQMIDAAPAGVRGDKLIRELGDSVHSLDLTQK